MHPESSTSVSLLISSADSECEFSDDRDYRVGGISFHINDIVLESTTIVEKQL